MARSSACPLNTGKAPGRPRHTGQTFLLGGSPKRVEQAQKAFVSVASWTCTSSPTTHSYRARGSISSSAVSTVREFAELMERGIIPSAKGRSRTSRRARQEHADQPICLLPIWRRAGAKHNPKQWRASLRGETLITFFIIFQESLELRMALICEICGKKPSYGNTVSHANNLRRRRWNPNLRRVKTVVGGVRKHVRACTACIRAGRVRKAA